MKFKIIIPTFNAGDQLEKLIVKIQKYKDDLFVIDSSSTDNTIDILNKHKISYKVIDRNDFNHGKTRNLAGKLFDCEFLIYITQDTMFIDSSSIEKIINVMEDDSSIAAVYGRQIPYENTNLFGKHLRKFNYKDSSYTRVISDKVKYGIKTAFLSNSFCGYRKKCLEEIGWFKDDLILGEDMYAGAKFLMSGYKLSYASDAVVYHSHSYSIVEEFKRYFDIGVFHRKENWLLKEFGKAEGEGKKYVVSEFKYILNNKKFYLIPSFFIRNFMKYLGYKLGFYYYIFPNALRRKLSMTNKYWE
ncbi:MAG: glycosyltransferase [Candidatus Muirbacterium halophilum]|nr:glycosyltransferase [Candidatus Muirbacterium halophilum]